MSKASKSSIASRVRHIELLNEVPHASLTASDFRALLHTMAERLTALFAADACHIALWDKTRQLPYPAAALGPVSDKFLAIDVQPGQKTLTDTVLQAERVLMVADVSDTELIDPDLLAVFPQVQAILGLPIIANGQKFGAALILFTGPRQFSEQELAWANQAASSLSNTLLQAEAWRQLDELQTLQKVALIGAAALTEDALIEETTRIIGETLYPDNFGFLIYDEHQRALRPHPSYGPKEALKGRELVPLDAGVAGHVLLTGQPWRIPDVRQAPAYMKVDDRTLSELCVPLKVDNRILGVINAESARLHAFTDADERLLSALAGQIATAISRIRLYTEERNRRQEAETLREAIAAVNSSLDLDLVLDTILVQLSRVVPYDSAALMLLEDKGLKLVAGRGFPEAAEVDLLGHYFAADDPLARQLSEEKRPLVLVDAQADPRFHSWGGTTYIRGWIGLPLIARGQVIGFLTIDNHEVGAYQESDALLAQSFAHQAATAIGNARLYQATADARRRADRRADELRTTARILGLLNATPEVAETFPKIADELEGLTRCQRVSLTLFEKRSDIQEATMTFLEGGAELFGRSARFQVKETMAAIDILAKRPHLTPDLAREVPYSVEASLLRAGFRSRISLPLVVRQQTIGALNLAWRQESGYDLDQLPLLMQISSAIALAAERSLLFTEINQHSKELEILVDFSTSLRQAAYVDEMLPLITESVSQVTPLLFEGILFVEPETDGDLVLRHVYPLRHASRLGRRMKAGVGVTGHVAQTGEVYVTGKLADDPRVHTIGGEAAELAEAGGSITLPLQTQERVIGVIHIILPVDTWPTESTLRMLVAIAEIAGSALDRALVLETLEQRVEMRTQELAAANVRLQELDRLKSKFVSDVSHELRTPVTNLRLYLDLLGRGKPERQPYYLDVLRQQTDRLSALIEDILNLSRLEMSGARVKFAPVDLNAIVQQVAEMHLPRIEAAGLQISFHLQPDLPSCSGERNQLAQVVMNLLENAIRYTEAGEIKIETEWASAQERIYLTISDTGMGIDHDEQEYIFDRFYRGRHTGQLNIPGTGLGLAIVKEIVNLHNGDIIVNSNLHEGSTFQVWIPT